ncbi:MAG TPA: hypothetical protein H9751_12280 [Candidatus Corynebacterium faecigallinarum]|uniref:Uncharacterized protein n=1 Tax=Candidatus Corynebacterium faecigallinarum TaxID=2838528 RepID=A0A9D2QEV8_9CORY|nr:hypothetical protein [Candidatus Corynebacterium faecigallinarum]
MRSSERIAPNRKVRRKREWADTRRPAWVMWLSVLCLVALGITVLTLSNSERMSRPQAINGDSLGPETGETVVDYVTRARESLVEAETGADSDDPRWALVTPMVPAGTEPLTEMLSDQADLRVSTLLAGNTQWSLPEPAVGQHRGDVFAEARALMAANAGVEVDDPALDVLGVLVHGTPAQLRALDDRPDVLTVEALPADAVYGRIGMRPVSADAEDSDAPADEGEPAT